MILFKCAPQFVVGWPGGMCLHPSEGLFTNILHVHILLGKPGKSPWHPGSWLPSAILPTQPLSISSDEGEPWRCSFTLRGLWEILCSIRDRILLKE